MKLKLSWQPASGHRAGWRVVRLTNPMQEHEGKDGRRIFFKTMAAAQRRADQLNAKPN